MNQLPDWFWHDPDSSEPTLTLSVLGDLIAIRVRNPHTGNLEELDEIHRDILNKITAQFGVPSELLGKGKGHE